MTGIQSSKERSCGAGERDTNPWLEDAVAFGDAANRRVEGRTIEWMRDDPDQLLGDVARQAGVAVERDAVAHLLQHGRVADGGDKAGIGRSPQQAVELLDLAPFAFPSHPHRLARVPLALTVEEEEAVAAPVCVFLVQGFDARACRGQNVGVTG